MNRERLIPLEVFPQFFALRAPAPQLVASVIIPARDEAAGICATLDALGAQSDLNDAPLNPAIYEIILLANNCRDNTATLARGWAARHPDIALHVVEIEWHAEQACVGQARRALMNAACARLLSLPEIEAPRAICSTDADTRVSPFWIAHTLEEMRLGAEAVGGRILLQRESEADPTRRAYLLDTAYRLSRARLESAIDPIAADPWPRHFQFFGASLAIAPDVYARIGGLPIQRCLEDMALEAELTRRDCAVRRSPNVVALTSARRQGRVETGLSTQLQEWADSDGSWLVASGGEIAWRARLKRGLRAQFARLGTPDDLEGLAAELNLSSQQLTRCLAAAPTFGALWLNIEERLNSQKIWAPVEVETALAQLRAMLGGWAEK